MRCAPILLALLLAGCPDHRVKATTVVDKDGSFTRELVFREKEKNNVWGFFAQPGGYELTGKPEDGIVARAEFGPGVAPGGIRVRLESAEGDRKARAGKPSRLHVRVEELVVGRLYLYREQFDVGVDPQRVRRELPEWVDVLGHVYLDALRRTFPDRDLAPLDKHWDVAVKPWLVQTVLRFQLLAAALMRDWQANRIGADESDWVHNPLVGTLLAELEASGLLTAEEATPAWIGKKLAGDDGTPDVDIDSKDVEDLVARLVRRRLAPGLAHLDEAQRAEVLKRILDPDAAFKQTLEASWERRFPGPQREKKQQELESLAVAALGAGALAIAENIDVDMRLEMPGRLLKTNGLLDGRAVRFRVDDTHFWFAGPMLHATSFVPAEGVKEDLDARRLLELAEEIRDVAPEDRAAIVAGGELDNYQLDVRSRIDRWLKGHDVSFQTRPEAGHELREPRPEVDRELRKTEGQKTVDRLGAAIKSLRGETIAARGELAAALKEYEMVVDNKNGDIVGHFSRFNSGLEAAEKRGRKIEAEAVELGRVARKLWAEWDQNVAQMASEDMKKRMIKRKEGTQARFRKMAEEGGKARLAYERLTTKLRDYASFLSVDLSRRSVAVLSKDWPELKKEAETVFGLIDGMLKAIDEGEKSIAR